MAVLPTFDTHARLATYNPASDIGAFPPPTAMHVQSAVTAGDGGGGAWYWDPASTATDDGGTVRNPSGTAPGRWVRVHEPGFFHASWWGVAASAVDNTAALQAAINAVKATGGTLRLPPGALRFASTVSCDDCFQLALEGPAPFQDGNGTPGTTLQFTGSTGEAITARSAQGFSLRRLAVQATALNGVMLDTGHSTAGGDSLNITLDGCTFVGGRTYAGGAQTIGVYFANTIGATVRDCSFLDCRYGVLGWSKAGTTPYAPAADSGYSSNIRLHTCNFGLAPIYNPHLTWVIDGCSFEGPGTETVAGGYAIDSDTPCLSIGLSVRGSIFGDGGAASPDPWVNLPNAMTPAFHGNQFSGGNRAIAGSGYQWSLFGNWFTATTAAVDFTGSTLGVTAVGNHGFTWGHPTLAGIGGGAGVSNLIACNQGTTSSPPAEIGGQGGLTLPDGVKIAPQGSYVKAHYSVQVASPTWSTATAAAGASISLLQDGFPAGGLNVGDTVTVGLADAALPVGVLLFGTVARSDTVQVALVNMSGAPYTPAAALRVDVWVHN